LSEGNPDIGLDYKILSQSFHTKL